MKTALVLITIITTSVVQLFAANIEHPSERTISIFFKSMVGQTWEVPVSENDTVKSVFGKVAIVFKLDINKLGIKCTQIASPPVIFASNNPDGLFYSIVGFPTFDALATFVFSCHTPFWVRN